MKYTAFFFQNRNIAVTDKKGQIPNLQRKPVPVMFAEFLEKEGYDPAEFLLKLPSGDATFFKTEYGWAWRLKQ